MYFKLLDYQINSHFFLFILDYFFFTKTDVGEIRTILQVSSTLQETMRVVYIMQIGPLIYCNYLKKDRKQIRGKMFMPHKPATATGRGKERSKDVAKQN